MSFTDEDRRDWLRLARSPNVGPVTFAALIARFGSAAAALAELPKLARRGGAAEIALPAIAHVDAEIEALADLGGRMIASCEAEFPKGLRALDSPPPIISVIGKTELLRNEAIAIVGARNASALGRKFAAQLASDLGCAGLLVVSGMARGIDSAAHEAAMTSGTCAVLAGGVDNIYPPENASLHERLRQQGAIVSEMPLGTAPQARHFPRRNRLISGLARGVIVVEAAENSGSLITARYALEQGREVFAVPGSPLDPRARGANHLIREGAALTESADDVLAVLRPILGRSFAEPTTESGHPSMRPEDFENSDGWDMHGRICELLGFSPVDIDELIRQTGAPAEHMVMALLELELAGRVRRHPGNRVSLA